MTRDQHAVRSQDYPHDRFDELPRTGRIGAHRVHAQLRFTWQYVIAGLIGVALLTTAGIVGVNLANSAGKLPEFGDQPKATAASPKTKPQLDPAASIVLLDGTADSGDLALRLDSIVGAEKWGVIAYSGPAATADVEISAVFYESDADEAAALGLAEKLGGLSAYKTSDYSAYGARLVVLLGSDYAGPGRLPA